MNRNEHLHFLAERTELQRILAGIPEEDRPRSSNTRGHAGGGYRS